MPTFRVKAALEIARGVKVFIRIEGGIVRQPRGNDRRSGKSKGPRAMLESARKTSSDSSTKKPEILSNRSRTSEGALPDFLIIGAQKSGTTFLYRMLGPHPHVRRANLKEIHYFDHNFDKSLEWYKSHFPPPRNKNDQHTVTGEASPYYIAHSLAPERVAKTIPQAKLIALLRNPVDRAFSHYHFAVRKGREHLSFEEALDAEEERLQAYRERISAKQGYWPAVPGRNSYLARGVYVDQIQKWHEFFDREQLLVLKSEDYFSDPPDTLKTALDFLELPAWEPEFPPAVNKGGYKERMNPETREQLREYFEPHNQRLYEYLGVDFGW